MPLVFKKGPHCKQEIFQQIMHEFKYNNLHSGRTGTLVRSRPQALAIAGSYSNKFCGKPLKKVPKKIKKIKNVPVKRNRKLKKTSHGV